MLFTLKSRHVLTRKWCQTAWYHFQLILTIIGTCVAANNQTTPRINRAWFAPFSLPPSSHPQSHTRASIMSRRRNPFSAHLLSGQNIADREPEPLAWLMTPDPDWTLSFLHFASKRIWKRSKGASHSALGVTVFHAWLQLRYVKTYSALSRIGNGKWLIA